MNKYLDPLSLNIEPVNARVASARITSNTETHTSIRKTLKKLICGTNRKNTNRLKILGFVKIGRRAYIDYISASLAWISSQIPCDK